MFNSSQKMKTLRNS